MQHLNEDDLVMHLFHEDDAPAGAQAHLDECAACRAELETLRGVLTLVDTAEVPEPPAGYGEKVWNRLRWKLDAPPARTRLWQGWVAAAAVVTGVFVAGTWWRAEHVKTIAPAAIATARPAAEQPAAPDRLLSLVVGDHLDNSERLLAEIAHADPSRDFDAVSEQRKAEELVAANRIYRQSALRRGDTRIASVLGDLEPVLAELAHSDGSLSPGEVESLQKRIDERGLLFKVRAAGAQVNGREQLPRKVSAAVDNL
ncbi:MAG TPA: hypothetical protein VEZ11_02785 [Thermoanaerobaculia bacterium]|nr:hypothetical protein [Thermoanaerobaculia bacterium]